MADTARGVVRGVSPLQILSNSPLPFGFPTPVRALSKAKRDRVRRKGVHGALGIADGTQIVVGDRAAVDGRCRATTTRRRRVWGCVLLFPRDGWPRYYPMDGGRVGARRVAPTMNALVIPAEDDGAAEDGDVAANDLRTALEWAGSTTYPDPNQTPIHLARAVRWIESCGPAE